MKLAFAIPASRPERVEHVLDLVKRLGADVAVVENGAAVGAYQRGQFDVLRSAPSAGAARNAGLLWARNGGADWISFCDDDDYYGPGYIEELRREIDGGAIDVMHKGIGFVRFDDGLYLFNNQQRYHSIMENSATVRVEVAPMFREVSFGEGTGWTAELRSVGAREKVLSPWNMVYNRCGDDHAFGATRVQFLRTFGPAKHMGAAVPDQAVDVPFDVASCPIVGVPSDELVFADLARLYGRIRGVPCSA